MGASQASSEHAPSAAACCTWRPHGKEPAPASSKATLFDTPRCGGTQGDPDGDCFSPGREPESDPEPSSPSSWKGNASVKEALETLDDREPLKRIVALIQLGRLAQHGDQYIVCMLCAMRSDCDHRVRRAVLDTLCQICLKGDERAITTAMACLKDCDSNVTVGLAAVRVLRIIPAFGDRRAIKALSQSMVNADRRMVKAALAAICELAPPNDPTALKYVSDLLGHEDESISEYAREALAHIEVIL